MRDHALVLDAFECVLLFCELQNNKTVFFKKALFLSDYMCSTFYDVGIE